MHRSNAPRRRGFTLVEVMATTAMLAALSTTTVVLLRGAQSAWSLHRDDVEVRHSALATLRHLTRTARQCTRVSSISASGDTSGYLKLINAAGTTLAYDHDAGEEEVLYGETTAASLLANSIKTMSFAGLKADGSSTTTNPDEIHAVRCTITYDLTRPAGAVTETLSSTAWLRAW